VIELQEQLEEAQRQVTICRKRAERPGSTLEDVLAYEKARNWLLSLENRVLKRITGLQRKLGKGKKAPKANLPKPISAKDVAEATFAGLQKAGS
jgi:hypothetical protein